LGFNVTITLVFYQALWVALVTIADSDLKNLKGKTDRHASQRIMKAARELGFDWNPDGQVH